MDMKEMHNNKTFSMSVVKRAAIVFLMVSSLSLVCLTGCAALSLDGASSVQINPGTLSDLQEAKVGDELPLSAVGEKAVESFEVLVSLDSYEIGNQLPEGAIPFRVNGGSGEGAAFGESADRYYRIDEQGRINDGWHVVNTVMTFTNPQAEGVQYNVGSMELVLFDEDGEQVVMPYGKEPIWFEPGDRNSKHYYTQTLGANSSASFGLSFVIRDDTLGHGSLYLVIDKKRVGTATQELKGFNISNLSGEHSEAK